MHVKFGDKNKTADLLKIMKLQEKALKTINVKNFDENANSLFKENQILNICDFIAHRNALFVRRSIKNKNLSLFVIW